MRKYTIEQEYITPCFPEKFSFIPKENMKALQKNEPKKNRFTIGNIYTLSGVECDDFEMPKKEYQLIDVVKNVSGVTLDSVVMKQISGEQSTIFSLTKNDCRNLRINFQQGLQLFPTNLNWVEKKTDEEPIKVEETIENKRDFFIPNNLSTYPLCHIDKTIRHIMIKISGCSFSDNTRYVVLPDRRFLRYSEFTNKLYIRNIRTLLGDNKTSANFSYGEYIPYRVMTKEIGNCITNDIVDSEGNIYLELFLGKQTSTTADKHIGVKPHIFNNQSFSSIFEVAFNEPTITTVTSQKRREDLNMANRFNSGVTVSDFRHKWGVESSLERLIRENKTNIAIDNMLNHLNIMHKDLIDITNDGYNIVSYSDDNELPL